MAEKLRTLDFGDGKGARVLVPDWNNVDNKPFGEMVMNLVDNQTIATSDGQGTIEMVEPLVAGREYTVVYNGAEYNVTATATEANEMPITAIGNLVVIDGEDTGEPFFIMYISGTTAIISLDGATEVILTIKGLGIKHIDAKYAPVSACFYVKNDEEDYYIYADKAMTRKVTASELLAVRNNVELVGVFDFYYTDYNYTNGLPVYIKPNAFMIEGNYVACSIVLAGGLEKRVNNYVFYTAEYTG